MVDVVRVFSFKQFCLARVVAWAIDYLDGCIIGTELHHDEMGFYCHCESLSIF
jgi:hypothetical protein